MNITELKYSGTNTYLIEGTKGAVLFDTGWAGTFPAFCSALGKKKKKLRDIDYILISHFHPDHYGIAQEIADNGPKIAIADFQKEFLHASDDVFYKEGRKDFIPIDESKVRIISLDESRDFLAGLGIEGMLLHTPGHSDDSISLMLDDGNLFAGDLNPLYELEAHKGTPIYETWEKLLALKPRHIYYGHAKSTDLKAPIWKKEKKTVSPMHTQVEQIIKYIDKGYTIRDISDKTGAELTFAEDVTRMYLTHRNVGVQGILDRIEIKYR